MGHNQCARRTNLDGEISICHRIKRIAAYIIKAQFFGNKVTINRKTCSGLGSST